MTEAPSTLLANARQFGDYWLGRRLGSGGQGVVHEAYDPTGTRVAIKLLKIDHAESHRARVRFAREVAAAGRVPAFCTARVITAGVDEPQPYIVSEYVDGPSLHRAVRERGPYGPAELRRLATGVATALTAIHMAGVVHRDLKPENVLLGADGLRVIDFGIARFDGATPTDDRFPIGTPGYIAPERLRGEPASPASDVWAWGAVVLFAAIGRAPFSADHPSAVHHLVLTRRPDVSPLREPLRRLVDAAMSAEPGDRPEARALLAELVGGKGETRLLLAAGSRVARAVTGPEGLPPEPDRRPLGEVAEGVYASLDPADRDIVPGVLLRLVLPGDGADGALRRARAGDLLDGTLPRARVERVLGGFGREKLLVHETDTVALASAALIRAWPRLRDWINADRAALGLHGRLAHAARLWDAGGRDPADLYRGAALRAALGWSPGRGHLRVNRLERSFLNASAARERARTTRRRQLKGTVAVLVAASLALVGVVILGGARESWQSELIAARRVAGAADRLRPADPVTSMLLGVAAWRLAPEDTEARGALYSAMAQREWRAFTPPVATGDVLYDLGGDGRTLAVLAGGVVTLWDVASGRPRRTIRGVTGPADVIALRADGETLAVGHGRSIRLWDLRTGRPAGASFGTGAARLGFSPGGDLLVVGHPHHGGQVWRLSDLGAPLLAPGATALDDIAVSADGRFLALLYGDGHYELRDRLAPLPPPGADRPATGHAAAFHPREATVAVSDGEDVRFWDIEAGRWREAALFGARATTITFSADGRHLVTYDGAALSLWRSGGLLLLRHPVRDLTGPPRLDGGADRLSYRLPDGRVILLDVAALTHPRGRVSRARAAAFSPDGRYAAIAGVTTELLRLPDGVALSRRRVPGSAAALAFSRDGARLAVGTRFPARVEIWDVRRAGPLWRPFAVTGADDIGSLAFHPRDGTLAVSPLRNAWRDVEVWDPRRGTRVGTLDHPGGDAVAFDPRGRTLVISGYDTSAALDLATGTAREQPFGQGLDGVHGLAYDRDGGRLATGWTSTGVDVRDGATLEVVRSLPAPEGDDDQFDAIAFAPDGRTLAAGGSTGRIWLWNLADGRRLGLPVPAHAGRLLAVAFAPDGRSVHSLGSDGALVTTPTAPEAVAEAVCARAGRSLTRSEWRRHVGDEPSYRPIC